MNSVRFLKKTWAAFEQYDAVLIVVFSLIAGHYMVVYQEPESFWVLMQYRFYYPALLGSTLIAFLLIVVIRLMSFYFDLRVSWISDFRKRLFLQLGLGTVLMSVVAFLLASAYFWLRGFDILETEYYQKDFWTVVLLICLLNVYYAAEYSFKVLRMSSTASEDLFEETEEVVGEVVAALPVELHAPKEHIAYVYHNQRINWVVGFDGVKSDAVDMTMAQLLKLLNDKDFFMLQKGFIVNRAAIMKVGKASSRRLMVYLKTPLCFDLGVVKVGLNEVNCIVVPQRQVKEFKLWHKGGKR